MRLWAQRFTLPKPNRAPRYSRQLHYGDSVESPDPETAKRRRAKSKTSPSNAAPVNDSAAAAFEKYVLPEVDVMYRVAYSLTRNAADAEDLVQDALLRAYRGIERFDGRHPRAWLLTILRNAQINRVRRKRPELLRDPDAALERLADTETVGSAPESVVVDSTFDATVHAAFESLPDKFAAVIEMVDLNGLSYQEAADALGVPLGTIMSRLHRARARIRKHLADHGVDSYRAAASGEGDAQ